MRLYFVRHGEAEELAATDHMRALTDRGKERVWRSAQVLKRLGISPVTIYSSPRVRARETAEIMGEVLDMEINVVEEVNFGFNTLHIKSLIQKLETKDEVMFVGHNPDMSQVVHKLTGASVSMKKGGLARVDMINARARRGELVWLIAPRVFEALYIQPDDVDLQQWLSDTQEFDEPLIEDHPSTDKTDSPNDDHETPSSDDV